jgi:hypothetical protein
MINEKKSNKIKQAKIKLILKKTTQREIYNAVSFYIY